MNGCLYKKIEESCCFGELEWTSKNVFTGLTLIFFAINIFGFVITPDIYILYADNFY